MQDTSPPILSAWSGLAAPECCLASRSPARKSSERLQAALESALQKRLHGLGSTIYQIAWKPHATPLGRQISRQRASAPRTSASEHSSEPSGWPTPTTRDWKDTAGMATEAVNPDGSTRTRLDQLGRQVQMAGWPTPMAGTPAQKGYNAAGNNDSSRKTVELVTIQGPARFTASGEMLIGCSAGMESGGQLNPAFSGWLMGYRRAWVICGWNAMEKMKMGRRAEPVPPKFCKTCGTQMERQRFNGRLEDKGAFARRVYCDQDCMAQDYEGTIKVMNDKNSRRQSAKTRKAKCEVCGRRAHHVHHRDENPQNNDPANLQSLCASCHKKEHLQKPASLSLLASDTGQPCCGDTAMRSIRTRRRSSSKPSTPAFDIFG